MSVNGQTDDQRNDPRPPEDEAPPRSGAARLLRPVIGFLVVAAIAAGFYFFTRSEVAAADVGECVSVVSLEPTAPELEVVDCGLDEAVFVIGAIGEGQVDACPDGDYQEYIEYVEGSDADSGRTWCLALNFVEGDCFLLDATTGEPTSSSCDEAEAITVAQLIEGTPDAAQCGEEETPMTYAEPASTLCLLPAGAAGA